MKTTWNGNTINKRDELDKASNACKSNHVPAKNVTINVRIKADQKRIDEINASFSDF